MSVDDYILRLPVDPEVAEAFDNLPNGEHEMGYDPWGFNPEIAKHAYIFGKLIYHYFRPVVEGIDNVPEGRVLIIPNHSGQLPFDGIVVSVACMLRGNPPRLLRQMVERWMPSLPYINEFFARSGAVLGDPINCRNLLEAENAILVFPEGARGCGKTWPYRYQLTRFGRGFMRLALQTQTPIVPVSVVGAEESIPSVANFKPLARLLGAPYFPIPVHLPLLGPLAYLPLPTRFHLTFGEPISFSGAFDDEDEAIDEKVDQVRATIQKMLNRGLAKRMSVF